MGPPALTAWAVFIVAVLRVKRDFYAIWTMPALRIRVMRTHSVTPVQLMGHLRARVPPGTRAWTVPKTSTSVSKDRPVNTTESVSTRLDRSPVIALKDSPDLAAKRTSMNANRIPARTTAAAWTIPAPSDASACPDSPALSAKSILTSARIHPV